jgi:hypothetical protein
MLANEKKLSRALFSNARRYSLPVFGFGWERGERILADRIVYPDAVPRRKGSKTQTTLKAADFLGGLFLFFWNDFPLLELQELFPLAS